MVFSQNNPAKRRARTHNKFTISENLPLSSGQDIKEIYLPVVFVGVPLG
jgi:hypothetical protein